MDTVTRYRATFQIEAVPVPAELRAAERTIREKNPLTMRYVSFGEVRTGAGVPGTSLDIFNLPNPVVDCVYDTTLPQPSAARAVTEGLAAQINGGTSLMGVVVEAWKESAKEGGAAAGEIVDAGIEGALDAITTSPSTLFVVAGVTYVVLKA